MSIFLLFSQVVGGQPMEIPLVKLCEAQGSGLSARAAGANLPQAT